VRIAMRLYQGGFFAASKPASIYTIYCESRHPLEFDEMKEQRIMISRIWHGWTTLGNADKYEALLKEEIFAGIQNRHIRGFKGIQLLRREDGKEVEFITIMTFDTLDAVRDFAGEDYEVAVVPQKAREVLSHFDERSQHYDIRAMRHGEGQ
jgi:heme-degrading monooxygenase HmoA